MSATASYTCEPQQRLLKLITLLAGNEVHGLAPGEIAKAQGCSPSVVTRDLANLAEGGYAERVPALDGRWRLSPQIVQIAVRHAATLNREQQRLDDTVARFSRG